MLLTVFTHSGWVKFCLAVSKFISRSRELDRSKAISGIHLDQPTNKWFHLCRTFQDRPDLCSNRVRQPFCQRELFHEVLERCEAK